MIILFNMMRFKEWYVFFVDSEDMVQKPFF